MTFSYIHFFQSLKSRGIRFPGRDNESLAPIFTPPRSVLDSESNVNPAVPVHHDTPVHRLSPEQTKETLDVARNSIELLTTVLSSSLQQDALKVFLFLVTVLILYLSFCEYPIFLNLE